MAITLRIENLDSLPDGGPLEYSAGERGFDIGRAQHLDWCLPDESRVISSIHCQIRFEHGGYWLYDVSRNGTYLNNAPDRVKSPHRLTNGDRLLIGDYVIGVQVSGGAAAGAGAPPSAWEAPAPPPRPQPVPYADIWAIGEGVSPPVDRRWFTDAHQPAPANRLQDFVEMPPAQWSGPIPLAPPIQAPPVQAPVVLQAPQPSPSTPASAGQGSVSGFLSTVANAAGMPAQALSSRPPEAIAEEVGFVLRIVAEQLAALLKARAAAKLMTRNADRTMIGVDRNNPLKFVPSPAEALEIMFQRNRPGYLGASDSVREGFENIKQHEAATYVAMQQALLKLMDDISPAAIEAKVTSSPFGSKKARAWEIYTERWREIEKSDNGLLDVYLTYFRESYEAAVNKG
ncbi:type VI secretion system protein ImpI [Devosia sp. UYZn731]|uniref:type VI secretion system-associated FHA domain protein TagH n=1 Tax=Devosia sp. UYZn731 TaxID=3156345 RepID=UPI003398F645